MPTQLAKFDQNKIDLLKSHLVLSAQRNTPKFYEIFVDTLKAVPKTDNPEEFEGYEDYISPDSSFVKIVIYSGLSPRNDKYFFSFKAQTQQEAFEDGLDGIAVKTYSHSELEKIKIEKAIKTSEQEEIKTLKKQVEELNSTLEQKQAHIERCEKGLQIAKENGNKIGGIHAGDVISRAVTGIIKQNSQAIEKVTGIDGLAGIIDNTGSSVSPQESAPDTEVTFKRKEATPEVSTLSDQEKEFLKLCKVLQSHFTEPEMASVMSILDTLSKNKSQIQPVLELLQD